jgi:hypothetical protein
VARLARLILAAVGVAFAVWLLPASVHIVDWTADGPVRVALLAPLWKLWIALALATSAAAGIAMAATGATVAAVSGPLALLWLWVIPYLPWSGEFRPSDREPGSTDHRRLGCQVRVGLR